jgi:hypothetical protein
MALQQHSTFRTPLHSTVLSVLYCTLLYSLRTNNHATSLHSTVLTTPPLVLLAVPLGPLETPHSVPHLDDTLSTMDVGMIQAAYHCQYEQQLTHIGASAAAWDHQHHNSM